jgi:hypothetical protein
VNLFRCGQSSVIGLLVLRIAFILDGSELL